MLELILIIALAILTFGLVVHVVWRNRKEKGIIKLKEDAVWDLNKAIQKNASAGLVSLVEDIFVVLEKHLKCEKAMFLVQGNNEFIPLYQSKKVATQNPQWNLAIPPPLQKKVCRFTGITYVSELETIFPHAALTPIYKMGLEYFFPILHERHFYGLFFIKTPLSPNNSLLKYISAELSLSLSAACHIDSLNEKVDKLKEKTGSQSAKSEEPSGWIPDRQVKMLKYLKIKSCRQLIPELMNLLKKDCNFSKFGFYVKSDTAEDPLITVKYNIAGTSDKILRDNHEFIIGRCEPDDIVELSGISESDPVLCNQLSALQQNGISHVTLLPWVNRKKAVLAWAGNDRKGEIKKRLKRFNREILPLVENADRFEKIEELSYTDGLTGMFNFRYFKKRIYEEFQRAKRYNRFLALIIFDIDDLKSVNDRHGHLAGDSLLVSFSKILQKSVRSNDVISRYGGDEFCLVMPEADRYHAHQFMERIRRDIISDKPLLQGVDNKIDFTVSIGGAVYPVDARSIDGLIHAADLALLKAKEGGRNRSRLFHPDFKRKT